MNKNEGKIIGIFITKHNICSVDCTMQIEVKDSMSHLTSYAEEFQKCGNTNYSLDLSGSYRVKKILKNGKKI